MAELDPRIMRVTLILDGRVVEYDYANGQGPAMIASGAKFGSQSQNEVEVRIANIDKPTRDYLLTEGTPFNRVKNIGQKRNRIIVEAGRESYGLSIVFTGDITTVSMTMPPDIWIVIKCLTIQYNKGDLISRSQPGTSKLSTIAQQIALDLGLALVFETTDINIGSYTYTGSAAKAVDFLGQIDGVQAFIDDDQLIVKDVDKARAGAVIKMGVNSGMIGIPEYIDFGIKVKFYLDNKTKVGSQLELTSEIYPAANGSYIIYKLEFEIATRDEPFFYIAEARRVF